MTASDDLIRSATPPPTCARRAPSRATAVDPAPSAAVDQFGQLRDVVAHAQRERELCLEVGLGDVAPRIGENPQRRGLRLSVHGQPHRVGARNRARPVSGIARVDFPAFDFCRPLPREVPDGALHARVDRQRLVLEVLRIFVVVAVVRITRNAAQRADDGPWASRISIFSSPFGFSFRK